MGYLNQLEIMGHQIDANTQVKTIVQSLSGSFNQFLFNYAMNRIEYTLPKLLNELVETKELMKKERASYIML